MILWLEPSLAEVKSVRPLTVLSYFRDVGLLASEGHERAAGAEQVGRSKVRRQEDVNEP